MVEAHLHRYSQQRACRDPCLKQSVLTLRHTDVFPTYKITLDGGNLLCKKQKAVYLKTVKVEPALLVWAR